MPTTAVGTVRVGIDARDGLPLNAPTSTAGGGGPSATGPSTRPPGTWPASSSRRSSTATRGSSPPDRVHRVGAGDRGERERLVRLPHHRGREVDHRHRRPAADEPSSPASSPTSPAGTRMSLYGQTGTGRHLNHYSHTLADDVGRLMRRIERAGNPHAEGGRRPPLRPGDGQLPEALQPRGDRIPGLRRHAQPPQAAPPPCHGAGPLPPRRRSPVPRWVHEATRRRRSARPAPPWPCASSGTYLGWTGSKRPVALGLFGPLHAEFSAYREAAERMCRRFDARFPNAEPLTLAESQCHVCDPRMP